MMTASNTQRVFSAFKLFFARCSPVVSLLGEKDFAKKKQPHSFELLQCFLRAFELLQRFLRAFELLQRFLRAFELLQCFCKAFNFYSVLSVVFVGFKK